MTANSFALSSFSTTMDVDLDALVFNLNLIRDRVTPAKVIAVVKANAMGHGVRGVAKALEAAGADMLAVSNFLEAVLLRDSGVKADLLAFNGLNPAQMRQAIQLGISFFGHDLEALELADKISEQMGIPAKIHIKIDTGMGRKGVLAEDAITVKKLIEGLKHIKIEGVASHLASPYANEHDEFSESQFEKFVEAAKIVDPNHETMWHFAASSGTLRFTDTYLDAVRVGALLYGVSRVWPLPWPLKPAGSYRTEVVQIKKLPKGHNVGYRLHYTAPDDIVVAIIPVGTTDALTSEHADTGKVLIRGKRCPIIGICSCEAMVDVTEVPDVALADEVVLFGVQGEEHVTAVDFAELGQTSYANLVTRIPVRTPRVYWKNGTRIGAEVMGKDVDITR